MDKWKKTWRTENVMRIDEILTKDVVKEGIVNKKCCQTGNMMNEFGNPKINRGKNSIA